MFCKVVDLAKIMGLSSTTFLSKTNSLACNVRKCHGNWTSALKSITKGVLQPKLLVISKIFWVHFFTLDPTEKKNGQAFFHQNNISGVISRFVRLGSSKCKFWPFLQKNPIFLPKQRIFFKKILETNFHYFCNFCQYFLLKWVVFCKKM